jgi:hypothetical protein
LFVSLEESLSLMRRRRTLTTTGDCVVLDILIAPESDGAVGDSRPFPVMLDRLCGVEEE